MTQNKHLVTTVLLCHFLASFTALGMPLFLPKVMQDLIGQEQFMLIGWYYILPTICTALAAPWWGRFADKYGKRLSLLRAQLGLAAGFMVAGLADSLLMFTVGLLIQGICGGTYAASNAYLATQVGTKALPKVLNWTQFSARMSLLVAPIVFGLLITADEPRLLYCYLAVLPLIAAIMVTRLPLDGSSEPGPKSASQDMSDAPLSFNRILLVQFLFSFSMVVCFPYFLPYAQQLGLNNDGLIGWYFSLPHLVYLVITAMKSHWQQQVNTLHLCAVGLIALIGAALIQMQLKDSQWLWFARILLGIGITLTFVAMHQCFSALKASNRAGLVFGRFDSAGKWAGVLAGVCCGLIVELYGLAAPFLLSALAATLALSIIYIPQTRYMSKEKTYDR